MACQFSFHFVSILEGFSGSYFVFHSRPVPYYGQKTQSLSHVISDSALRNEKLEESHGQVGH